MQFIIRYIFIILAIVLCSCSREKNTLVSRSYHNLTAHYNIYFNAEQNYIYGNKIVKERYIPDYTAILPIFIETETESKDIPEFDIVAIKGNKLIDKHSITKKPQNRNYSNITGVDEKKEWNKWVDDSYLLMGKAYFAQGNYFLAAAEFDKLIQSLPNSENYRSALIWYAKSKIYLNDYQAAEKIIEGLLTGKPITDSYERFNLKLTEADLSIHRLEYKRAISSLNEALVIEVKEKDKNRYRYILAQLYLQEGDITNAVKNFDEVKKQRDDVDLYFNAKISNLELSSDSIELAEAEIKKLLKRSRNIKNRSRIYYTLASIYNKLGEDSKAIEAFKIAIEVGTDNEKQIRQSALELARLFYKKERYSDALTYYNMVNEISDRTDILSFRRASALTSLIENISIIAEQINSPEIKSELDYQLFNMDPKSEEIADIVKSDAANRLLERGNNLSNSNISIFQNQDQMKIEKDKFISKWGDISLEEMWGYSPSAVIGKTDEDILNNNIDIETLSTAPSTAGQDTTTIEQKELTISDINSNIFKAAELYATEINNIDISIKLYRYLEDNCLDPELHAITLYSLHKIYEDIDPASQKRVKDKIIKQYPESHFSKIILDPSYLTKLNRREQELKSRYKLAIELFQDKNYIEASKIGEEIAMETIDLDLKDKARFIQTISEGVAGGRESLMKNSEEFKSDNSDLDSISSRINRLAANRTMEDIDSLYRVGYLRDIKSDNETDSILFERVDSLMHSFVIIYPKSSSIDVDRVIYNLAIYNLEHYSTKEFDIEKTPLSKDHNMIVVRGKMTLKESKRYMALFNKEFDLQNNFNGVEQINFFITTDNYRKLFKVQKIDRYIKFMRDNY